MSTELVQRIGDYEVLAPLGAGGMGRVYKVRNVISNREEAMKFLLPDFASDPELAARFMAEIRTLAGLEHPGIAQLRTAFQIQNQFVMVMEFVEGTTLEKLAAQTHIPPDHVLDYAMQVLAALRYAHSRGVTHRDIKPANIMITSHGLVKLMDFGIAKSTNDMQLTRPGTTMGSVYYMSPEQVRGGTVDARSDLYSLGVTLYEMLTGQKPFQADTSYSVLNAQLNDPPTPLNIVNPAIPPQLNEVVLRVMAKRPEDRFQTAEEFSSALKAVRVPAAVEMTQPIPTPEPDPAPAFAPVYVFPNPGVAAPKSHRGLWIGLGAVTAILALVPIAWLLPHIFATHAGQRPATPAPDTQTSSASAPAPSPEAATTSPQVAASTDTSPPAAQAPQTVRPRSNSAGAHMSASSTRPAYTRPQQGSVSTAQAPIESVAAAPVSSPAAPSGPSQQEMRKAHDRLMNLDARAEAASGGVQQLRSQQQAQGLDMRGDILAAMSRMHRHLEEANRALSQSDLDTANEYMEHAETEIAVLEKFLGR
jgi:eukaryotic-like serine/threonine-protein kinase